MVCGSLAKRDTTVTRPVFNDDSFLPTQKMMQLQINLLYFNLLLQRIYNYIFEMN